MEFSYAIFNYIFIVRIPSLNSAMPAASFDVALSRLLHTVLSQACSPCLSRATWSGSLAYLCASVLSSSAIHPVPHSLHPTCCTPCTLLALFNSQTSVCSLELLLQLLRLFGRLSVCSTLQQCHSTVYMLYPAYSYVLHIYAHLRGVLCI